MTTEQKEGNVYCTFDEMVENDLIPGDIFKQVFEGFTIGKRGKQLFWHYNPTVNGFYAIFPQFENGEVGMPRYIDGTKTFVTCQRLTTPPPNKA